MAFESDCAFEFFDVLAMYYIGPLEVLSAEDLILVLVIAVLKDA